MSVLEFRRYSEQTEIWPKTGRHILAQYDDHTVVVYQAYNRRIGQYAVEHGRFGDDFSFSRMSWIKTNFLWMMYRSGWGIKENQDVTLALRLRRGFFESLLASAVASVWDRELFASKSDWSKAVEQSSVRLQWDPDHGPTGAALERRAIQLGLRGDVLDSFARRELIEVIDLSEFVTEQRSALSAKGIAALVTPTEHAYRLADPLLRSRLRLDEWS